MLHDITSSAMGGFPIVTPTPGDYLVPKDIVDIHVPVSDDPSIQESNVHMSLSDALTTSNGDPVSCVDFINPGRLASRTPLLPGGTETVTTATPQGAPSDYLNPKDIAPVYALCTDSSAREINVYSQPPNALTNNGANNAMPCDVVNSPPLPSSNMNMVTMTTNNPAPSDYLVPTDIVRTSSANKSTSSSTNGNEKNCPNRSSDDVNHYAQCREQRHDVTNTGDGLHYLVRNLTTTTSDVTPQNLHVADGSKSASPTVHEPPPAAGDHSPGLETEIAPCKAPLYEDIAF